MYGKTALHSSFAIHKTCTTWEFVRCDKATCLRKTEVNARYLLDNMIIFWENCVPKFSCFASNIILKFPSTCVTRFCLTEFGFQLMLKAWRRSSYMYFCESTIHKHTQIQNIQTTWKSKRFIHSCLKHIKGGGGH